MTVTESAVNIEAARELLEREQVHTVECMFADTWGIPRGKRLATKHFYSAAAGPGNLARFRVARQLVDECFMLVLDNGNRADLGGGEFDTQFKENIRPPVCPVYDTHRR